MSATDPSGQRPGSLAHLFAESTMPTAPHGAFTFGGAVAPSPSEANGTGERAEAYVGAAPPSRKKALRITDSTDLIMVNQKSGKKDAIEWISGLVDNLRARNDPNVVLFGLEQLHNALHSKEGAATLERLHGASSDFTELLLVWDNKRKGTLQGPIDEKLLLTISRLAELASKCADPRIVHGIDGLLRQILRSRMKAVYHHLSSTSRGRSNGALHLLYCIASRGPALSRELLSSFDWTLSALKKLPRPPKYGTKADQEVSTDSVPSMVGTRTYFLGRTVLGRPNRPGFVLLALTLLRSKDKRVVEAAARCEHLMRGLLHHVASDPPGVFGDIMDVLEDSLFSPTSGLPSNVLGQVVDADTLLQLIAVAQGPHSGDPETERLRERSSALLFRLCTDPSLGVTHGAAADPASLLAAWSEGGGDECEEEEERGKSALVTFLLKLHPTSDDFHARVVLSTCLRSPSLAAAVLGSIGSGLLEPKPTAQFARAAALTCKLMSIARSAPSSAPAGQQRAQELLRAPLTRASLTRGLQHPSLAVRIPALDLLLQVLRSLAAAAPPGDGSIGWACEERDRWEAFVRSALPDPQVIVGLRASIGEGWRSVGGEKGAGEARERSGNGKGGDGMGDGSSQSGEDSSGDADMASEDGVGDDADMPSKDGVGDEADMASEGSIEEDDEGGPGVAPGREGKERGEGDRGAVRAARRAFAVAAEHHALVPAWWAESGADPAALVPQGWSDGAGADVRCAAAALGLVSRQMQPLEALQLSSLWGGALGKGGADGWRPVGWVTPGALQALAGLLRACRVRTQARRAFCGALMSTGLMGGAGAVEAACWVDAVERAGSTDASQALARFVGQAVAQCAQRPHLAFGAADRARALAALAPTSAAPSPLLVSALADGGKVLQSAKAPPEQQAAVADFLGALCQSAARASRDPAAWSTAASGAILAAFSGGLEKASAPEWVPPSETVLQGLPPSAGPLLAAFRGLRKAAEGLLDGSTAGGGGGASRANAKKRSGGDSGKKRRRAESDAEHHDRPRGSAAALEGPSFLHMPLEEALASGYAPAFVSAHLAVALGHLGDPSGAVGSAAVAAGAIRALLSEGDGVGPTGGPPASVCGARDGPSEACVGANGTEGEAGSVGKVDRDGERGGEVATGAWGEQAGDVCLRRQLGEALGRWVLEEEGLDAVVDASVDQVAAGLGSGYLELVLVLSQVASATTAHAEAPRASAKRVIASLATPPASADAAGASRRRDAVPSAGPLTKMPRLTAPPEAALCSLLAAIARGARAPEVLVEALEARVPGDAKLHMTQSLAEMPPPPPALVGRLLASVAPPGRVSPGAPRLLVSLLDHDATRPAAAAWISRNAAHFTAACCTAPAPGSGVAAALAAAHCPLRALPAALPAICNAAAESSGRGDSRTVLGELLPLASVCLRYATPGRPFPRAGDPACSPDVEMAARRAAQAYAEPLAKYLLAHPPKVSHPAAAAEWASAKPAPPNLRLFAALCGVPVFALSGHPLGAPCRLAAALGGVSGVRTDDLEATKGADGGAGVEEGREGGKALKGALKDALGDKAGGVQAFTEAIASLLTPKDITRGLCLDAARARGVSTTDAVNDAALSRATTVQPLWWGAAHDARPMAAAVRDIQRALLGQAPVGNIAGGLERVLMACDAAGAWVAAIDAVPSDVWGARRAAKSVAALAGALCKALPDVTRCLTALGPLSRKASVPEPLCRLAERALLTLCCALARSLARLGAPAAGPLCGAALEAVRAAFSGAPRAPCLLAASECVHASFACASSKDEDRLALRSLALEVLSSPVLLDALRSAPNWSPAVPGDVAELIVEPSGVLAAAGALGGLGAGTTGGMLDVASQEGSGRGVSERAAALGLVHAAALGIGRSVGRGDLDADAALKSACMAAIGSLMVGHAGTRSVEDERAREALLWLDRAVGGPDWTALRSGLREALGVKGGEGEGEGEGEKEGEGGGGKEEESSGGEEERGSEGGGGGMEAGEQGEGVEDDAKEEEEDEVPEYVREPTERESSCIQFLVEFLQESALASARFVTSDTAARCLAAGCLIGGDLGRALAAACGVKGVEGGGGEEKEGEEGRGGRGPKETGVFAFRGQASGRRVEGDRGGAGRRGAFAGAEEGRMRAGEAAWGGLWAERMRCVAGGLGVDPDRAAVSCVWMDVGSTGWGEAAGGEGADGRAHSGVLNGVVAEEAEGTLEGMHHGDCPGRAETMMRCGVDALWVLLMGRGALLDESHDASAAGAPAVLLPVALRGLGSDDVALRAVAHDFIRLFCKALPAARFRDKPLLEDLMVFVQRGVARHGISPAAPIQPGPALFLAHCARAFLTRGSPIAKQLRKVLRRKRELSPSEIPGYMDLIMSGRVGKDGDSDRIHAMLLASGAAATSEFVCGHTPTDAVKPPVSAPMPADAAPGREASLLRRQYVFEMIVGGPRSRDVPRKIKWAACAAVAALCRSPRYGRDLVNRLGLLPWAAQAVREVLTQRPGSSGAFVGRAAVDAVVTLLCGVAAALEHGAERGGAEDVAMDVCTLVDAVCAAAEELKATAPNHARELVRAACKVGTAAASHSSFVEGHAGAASAPSLAHALGRVSSRAVAAGLRAPGLAVQVASAAACGSVAGAALGLLEACSMAGAAETGGFYQVSIAGVPEAATLCALACLGHSGALAVSGTSASKRAVLGGGLDGEEGNKAAAASDIVGVAWGLKGVAEASGGDVAVGADCDVALQMVIRGLAASLEAAEGGETDKSAVEKVRRGALAGAKMLVV